MNPTQSYLDGVIQEQWSRMDEMYNNTRYDAYENGWVYRVCKNVSPRKPSNECAAAILPPTISSTTFSTAIAYTWQYSTIPILTSWSPTPKSSCDFTDTTSTVCAIYVKAARYTTSLYSESMATTTSCLDVISDCESNATEWPSCSTSSWNLWNTKYGQIPEMMGWCFRQWFCTARLYWAGNNLGEWDEFCYVAQDRSLDMLASSPAHYHCTIDAPTKSLKSQCVVTDSSDESDESDEESAQDIPNERRCNSNLMPKLDTYHGDPAKWSGFLFQFKEIARINQGSERL